MTRNTGILTFCILMLFSLCSAKEFIVLGPYNNVRILKIDYKGIQISHSGGTGYLDLKKLSKEDEAEIAAEIEEYQACLKNRSAAIAAERTEKTKAAKAKKAADAFAVAFIKAIGQPKKQQGYLLATFTNLARRYKIKMTIPKKNKDGTLPLLYKQYETLRKFVAAKTEGATRRNEALKLLDSHYMVYKRQRQMTIIARNKKAAAAKKKKPAPAPASKGKPAPAPAPASTSKTRTIIVRPRTDSPGARRSALEEALYDAIAR